MGHGSFLHGLWRDAGGATYPARSEARAGVIHLRLLETTDLHAHVLPYDYCTDRPARGLGLSLTAVEIARARAEAGNVLLFDNGDFLQGNPLGDVAAAQSGSGAPHPVVVAMNTLGYDAVTLGNHEFNHGLPLLLAALSRAAFPVVASNVVPGPGTEDEEVAWPVPTFTLLDRLVRDGVGATHPLRIGVLGFLPPQIVQWDRQHLAGRIGTRDIVDAARRLLPVLHQAGADLVLALCHSGIAASDHTDGMENAALPLAALPGIDVVLTGHSHLVFPGSDHDGLAGVDPRSGRIMGKPAVMAGAHGSHLGVIDLRLERVDGRWTITDSRSDARAVSRLPASAGDGDPAVLGAASAAHAATLARIRQPVGHVPVALQSHLALVAPCLPVTLVAAAQARELARALAGTGHADLPLLSAAAPFRAGGRGGPGNFTDIPAGPLYERHLADLCPFPNTVTALRITGAQLHDWLERAAGIFRQVTPGAQDADLIDPDIPAYGFDTILGLTCRIDLSCPARHDRDGRVIDPGTRRITDLCHRGRPVDPDASFLLAANSYRAAGGGGFAAALAAEVVWQGTTLVRDQLAALLRAGESLIDPHTPDPWTFAPMPGTTVLFPSAPDAARHLGAVAGRRIEPTGRVRDGFALFRLHL